MINREQYRKHAEREEKKVNHAYQDSKGYWTIGIGTLIDERRGGSISDKAIDFLFNEKVDEKIAQLDTRLSWWKDLDEVRALVILDMCYNLGIDGLLGFKNTLALIQAKRYSEAADRLLISKAATQDAPNRYKRLAQMLRTGKYI
jgi:lysozyme